MIPGIIGHIKSGYCQFCKKSITVDTSHHYIPCPDCRILIKLRHYDEDTMEDTMEDTVEKVIRCKDCKFFMNLNRNNGGVCCLHSKWFKLDDFCSYGERVKVED